LASRLAASDRLCVRDLSRQPSKQLAEGTATRRPRRSSSASSDAARPARCRTTARSRAACHTRRSC
jgi:hypothetical protein